MEYTSPVKLRHFPHGVHGIAVAIADNANPPGDITVLVKSISYSANSEGPVRAAGQTVLAVKEVELQEAQGIGSSQRHKAPVLTRAVDLLHAVAFDTGAFGPITEDLPGGNSA